MMQSVLASEQNETMNRLNIEAGLDDTQKTRKKSQSRYVSTQTTAIRMSCEFNEISIHVDVYIQRDQQCLLNSKAAQWHIRNE